MLTHFTRSAVPGNEGCAIEAAIIMSTHK